MRAQFGRVLARVEIVSPILLQPPEVTRSMSPHPALLVVWHAKFTGDAIKKATLCGHWHSRGSGDRRPERPSLPPCLPVRPPDSSFAPEPTSAAEVPAQEQRPEALQGEQKKFSQNIWLKMLVVNHQHQFNSQKSDLSESAYHQG